MQFHLQYLVKVLDLITDKIFSAFNKTNFIVKFIIHKLSPECTQQRFLRHDSSKYNTQATVLLTKHIIAMQYMRATTLATIL